MDKIKTKFDALRGIEDALGDKKNTLPSLPQAFLRVQHAIDDSGMGAKGLANVILEDPALTASVLRLANSAYYRHSRARIRTITSAIVLLGFDTIRNLALGLSVYNMLNNLPRGANYRQLWRHSLCCGVCARHFAQRMKLDVPEEAFVAGLLHDIGKLIFGHFFPDLYPQVRNLVRTRNLTYLEAEREVMKCTHMEVGSFIGEYWKFPEAVVRALGNHETDSQGWVLAETHLPLVKIIMVANKVAHYLFQDDLAESLELSEIAGLCRLLADIESDEIEEVLAELRGQVKGIARLLDIVVDDWRFEAEDGSAKAAMKSERSPDPHTQAQLKFLLQVVETSPDFDDFPQFLQDTIENLLAALGMDSLILLFKNRERNCLEAKFGYGPDVERIRSQVSILLDTADDVAAYAFLRKVSVIMESSNLHRFSRLNNNLVTLLGTFNIAAIPIIFRDKPVGVFVAARDYEAESISGEDLRILNVYVRKIDAVLAQAYRKRGTEVLRKSQSDVVPRVSPEAKNQPNGA